jgi:thiosulfate/3-mercaptopyruvate sulfurtransferase
MITIDANWLASHLDCQDIVIIDARGIIPFRFRHIQNARPLGLEGVILVADNGAKLWCTERVLIRQQVG